MFYICKFHEKTDDATRYTKCWFNFLLKCYTNAFVSADTQIASNYRSSERRMLPKALSTSMLGNLKPTANELNDTKRAIFDAYKVN